MNVQKNLESIMGREKIDSGETLSSILKDGLFIQHQEHVDEDGNKIEFVNENKIEVYKETRIAHKEIEISYSEFIDALRDNDGSNVIFEDCVFNFSDNTLTDVIQNLEKVHFKECVFKSDFIFGNIEVYTPDFEIFFECCEFEKKATIREVFSQIKGRFKIISKGNTYHNKIKLSKFKSTEGLFIVDICDKIIDELELHDISNLKLILCSPVDLLVMNRIRLDINTGGNTIEFGEFRVFDCEFNTFQGNINVRKYEFWSSIIKPKLWFNGNFEIESFYANNTTFEKPLSFRERSMYVDSNLEHHKINSAVFNDCDFSEKVEFLGCEIKKIKFDNCSFNKLAKFGHFKGEVEEISFIRSVVHKPLFLENITSISGDCIFDFSDITVEDTGHIKIRDIDGVSQRRNEKKGGMNFQNANILGAVTIQDSKFNSIDLEKSTISGQFNIENEDIQNCSNRGTARRIKNEFQKNSDTVNALKYRAIEMNLYRNELWKNIKKFKLSYFLDFVLLILNTVSNNNGRNWFQGLIFTIACWIVFFGLFLGIKECWSGDTFFLFLPFMSEHIDDFVKYLWLPHGFEGLFNGVSVGFWGIFVFILGKIFIAYGIYQTIAAFRKYGK